MSEADIIRDLRAQLEEKQRQLEEKQRQLEEKQRQLEEKQRQAEEIQRQVDQLQELARQQTFEEYLSACHEYLHGALVVETDKSLPTQGNTNTNTKNKFHPERLQVWKDYTTKQQELFSKVYECFHPQETPAKGYFESQAFLEQQSKILRRRRIASEKDLEFYERTAVENAAGAIINELPKSPLFGREKFGIEGEVVFNSHANPLSDLAGEIQQLSSRTPGNSPVISSESENESDSEGEYRLPRCRADQFCVYEKAGISKRLLFLIEYKPPHRLSTANLQVGLRELDLKRDVFDRTTIPSYTEKPESEMTDDDRRGQQEKLQYNSEKLVTHVMTQTFHTMIEFGLDYSYLTNGEAFVMLHINWDNPQTLYYHLCIPSEAVPTTDGADLTKTAVTQCLCMSLMALKSTQHGPSQRKNAKKGLGRYNVDDEAILRDLPESERKAKPSPGYYARKPTNQRSPYLFRQRTRKSCSLEEDDDPDAGIDGRSRAILPTDGASRNQGHNQKTPADREPQSDNKRTQTQCRAPGPSACSQSYCSLACLLGVVTRGEVDLQCPNMPFHKSVKGRHAINAYEFNALLSEQLANNLDEGCTPLWITGSRGTIFKITLLQYNYVLLAKGTVSAFEADLQHEANVYRYLQTLQGHAIPVCFGLNRLKHRYPLEPGVKVTMMLFLAWVGRQIGPDRPLVSPAVQKTLLKVRSAGIDQADFESRNLLWCEEKQQVFMIDFERAVYITKVASRKKSSVRRLLEEMSPNKRRRLSICKDACQ